MHAVYPGRYFYRGGNPIMSVTGSSEDGNCSLLATTVCSIGLDYPHTLTDN